MTSKEQFRLMYNALKIEYKGIKLNKVLCNILMCKADDKNYSPGPIKSISKFAFKFDTSELRKIKLNELLITFGYYPSRKDHRQLMQKVAKRLHNSSFIDTSHWSRHKICISPKNIFKGLIGGLYQMRNTYLNLYDRLLLASQITFYLNTIDALSKIDFSNVKKYLCLANTLDLENLLTQFFKQKGIKTYSLMEGVLYIHKNSATIMNIPFENMTSDVQLCWGQFSKEEFIRFGYPENRTAVVGYPKESIQIPMKNDNSLKKCIVLLSFFAFDDQNKRLITLLSNLSDEYDFYLKLHPSLNILEYAELSKANGMNIIPKEQTIDECVNNTAFDFAITITSTTYYEALMRGLPCLRYYDGSYTPMAGCDDEFDCIESFKKQLNRIKTMSPEEYQKEVNYTLEYAIGLGIDNYKNVLEPEMNNHQIIR